MGFNAFEDMPVWQKGMDLAQQIFLISDGLSRKEDYGLTSQIRRSALSVAGNIAEGFGRRHTRDKLRFYYASRGSLAETRNHVIYGLRVGYFKEGECCRVKGSIDEIWKGLNALIRTLENRAQP